MITVPTGLYAITPTSLNIENLSGLIKSVTQAIQGGACLIQYRDKQADLAKRYIYAKELTALCHTMGVLLIINDDIDLAYKVKADGVHLGCEDASIAQARAQLGTDAIIGISCYTDLQRAKLAELEGASYVAFGSFFASTTKPDAPRAQPSLLQVARQQVKIPLVAIGGITLENGGTLIAAGAQLLAVSAGLFNSTDVFSTAQAYKKLFN